MAIYNKEQLYKEMEAINADKSGIKIMVPKGEFFSVKVKNVPLKAALVLKQEMLSK